MKTTLSWIVALLIAVINPVNAKEELSPAMQLMKLMKVEQTMENTSRAAFAPYLQQLRTKGMAEEGIKEVQEASDVYFSQVASDPDLRKEMTALYEKEFTASELMDLVEFYKSPLGQKALNLMPKMAQAGGKLGEKYAAKYSAGFKEQLTRIMKKYPMK